MRSIFQKIRSSRKQETGGFTIVELLIVIVIIAILAAIVVVAYNGITQRANASAIADGFKKIEKAMRLTAVDEGYSAWPTDTAIVSGYTNPAVATLIANLPTLQKYLQSAPNVAGVSSSSWRYDSDGDVRAACGDNSNGTNIYIGGFTNQALAQSVDDAIDDGDLNCGKLWWNANVNLMYNLSSTSTL